LPIAKCQLSSLEGIDIPSYKLFNEMIYDGSFCTLFI
jgi:hypothetical protein